MTGLGRKARHVGEPMVAVVPRELADGQRDLEAARMGGLQTKGALDACLSGWHFASGTLRDKVLSTGDKLASTSNITNVHDEDAAAELFRRAPSTGTGGGMRPI